MTTATILLYLNLEGLDLECVSRKRVRTLVSLGIIADVYEQFQRVGIGLQTLQMAGAFNFSLDVGVCITVWHAGCRNAR